MRNMAHEAGYRALNEVEMGRTVLILFPNKSWGAVMFEMGQWPEGITPGTTDCPEDAIPVYTVITVADEKCDQEMVSSVPCSKRIRIFKDGRDNVVEYL